MSTEAREVLSAWFASTDAKSYLRPLVANLKKAVVEILEARKDKM